MCRGCGERKIPTAFHRDVRSKNGRARRCKTCVKDYQIGWSTRNKRSYTPPSGTKLCPRCGEEKPVDEFHRATAAADGLGSWCKVCKSDIHRSAARKPRPLGRGLFTDVQTPSSMPG